jgi:hypothetical protein
VCRSHIPLRRLLRLGNQPTRPVALISQRLQSAVAQYSGRHLLAGHGGLERGSFSSRLTRSFLPSSVLDTQPSLTNACIVPGQLIFSPTHTLSGPLCKLLRDP